MASSLRRSINRQAQNTLRGRSRIRFDQIRQRGFWSAYWFQPDANKTIPAGRYTLFTTPVGSNGQGFPSGQVLTERESNWKSQNRVPDNQNLAISEIGVSVMSASFGYTPVTYAEFERNHPPDPTGLSNFFNSATLSITYLTNSVPLGLLVDFAQAGGPFMGITQNAGGAPQVNAIVQNGMGAPGLRRKHKIPIVLAASRSFNFTIELQRPCYIGGPYLTPWLTRVELWATESFSEQS